MAISTRSTTVSTQKTRRIERVGTSSSHRSISARHFVLIASGFNPSITKALVRGATHTLHRAGVSDRQIQVLWVPGAFELPVVAARAVKARPRPDAIIALGALIRGDTPQYTVIAQAVAEGLMHVSVKARIPVTFGVIVAETLAQAQARAGGSEGNRGREAAEAALAVLQTLKTVT